MLRPGAISGGLLLLLLSGAPCPSDCSSSTATREVTDVWSGPGPKDKQIERFVIDLDAPPERRWAATVKAKQAGILGLLDLLRPLFEASAPLLTAELIAAYNASGSLHSAPTYMREYLGEMRGIAEVLAPHGVSYRDVLMANLFYEISGIGKTPLSATLARSCTSLVAQTANGTVLFGRNQDYPPPFTLVMIHAVFQRGGQTVYEGTTYAGTVGLSTGFSSGPHGWAVSVNARDIPSGWPAQGSEGAKRDGVKAARTGAAILPILARQGFDAGAKNYNTAVKYYAEFPSILPGYLIVAGAEPGAGAIVSHNGSTSGAVRAADSDVFSLLSASIDSGANGGWFVVQTNTDHWLPAPNYTGYPVSRRGTAIHGLIQVRMSLFCCIVRTT
jgi:hypothetical protein